MAYLKINASNLSYYDLYIHGDGQIYANPDSSYLFYNFKNVDSINNMSILDTSNVTNMSHMFYYTGYLSTKFTLDCSRWNVKHTFFNDRATSKVTLLIWQS